MNDGRWLADVVWEHKAAIFWTLAAALVAVRVLFVRRRGLPWRRALTLVERAGSLRGRGGGQPEGISAGQESVSEADRRELWSWRMIDQMSRLTDEGRQEEAWETYLAWRRQFSARGERPRPPARPPLPPPPAPGGGAMIFHFACPRCKRPLRAQLQTARRIIRCPTCGTAWRLPGRLPEAMRRLYQRTVN